jgi:hypothetical protein
MNDSSAVKSLRQRRRKIQHPLMCRRWIRSLLGILSREEPLHQEKP